MASARLLVVGSGLFPEDDARFDRLVIEHGLEKHILRAGWVPEQELPDHFGAADVALYPLEDTLLNRAKCPAKLVELLAAGVPVVADRVGQALEYVADGETGLLVPPGDEEAMAEAAQRLLRDGTLRHRIATAAESDVRTRFDWGVLAEGLGGLYASMV